MSRRNSKILYLFIHAQYNEYKMFFATCDERIEKLLCYKMDGCEIPYTKLTEKEFPKSIEEF